MEKKIFYFMVYFCLVVVSVCTVVDTYNFAKFLDAQSKVVEVGEVTYNPGLK